MCFLRAFANSGRSPVLHGRENIAITFTAKCSILAGWKNPRRGVYRRVRLHFAQSSSGHRSKCRMRFLLGPCGALCAQIWPLGGQNRARGTFASLRTDGEISEVPRNTPFFHQLLGRNKHFPAFPSMIRACYGRCESLTTFQCQVVENEAWPQTDRSLELPPVPDVSAFVLYGRVIVRVRVRWGCYS